jgi:hypothetical protein
MARMSTDRSPVGGGGPTGTTVFLPHGTGNRGGSGEGFQPAGIREAAAVVADLGRATHPTKRLGGVSPVFKEALRHRLSLVRKPRPFTDHRLRAEGPRRRRAAMAGVHGTLKPVHRICSSTRQAALTGPMPSGPRLAVGRPSPQPWPCRDYTDPISIQLTPRDISPPARPVDCCCPRTTMGGEHDRNF